MKWFLDKLVKLPLWYHLVFAVVLTGILLTCTFKWLEVYTRHNEAVVVPNVKGLKLNEAADFLKRSGLRYNVIDSVFSKEVPPGAIVEVSPTAGSKVKEGRIIFVTINAVTSQMGTIPEVTDLSVRQAYALLRARGFENVETLYVPGDYKDLAMRVEYMGRQLNPEEKVSLSSNLTLIVSSGVPEYVELDSLDRGPNTFDDFPVEPVDSVEENWF